MERFLVTSSSILAAIIAQIIFKVNSIELSMIISIAVDLILELKSSPEKKLK